MRNARRQVRHERSVRRERSTTPAPPVVAVTGAARGVGQALAVQLAESPLIDRVVAIDDHRGDAARVTWRVADVRDPTLAARLAGVDARALQRFVDQCDVARERKDFRSRRKIGRGVQPKRLPTANDPTTSTTAAPATSKPAVATSTSLMP